MCAIVATLFLLSAGVIASGQGRASSAPVFRSATVLSASDVTIPFNSVAIGMVELHLTIGDTGKVEDVRVVRELASVTEQSVSAVKSWSFAPATFDGRPIPSPLTVTIVFCPFYGSQEMSLSPVSGESEGEPPSGELSVVPPEIIAGKYPVDSPVRAANGTVVFQVTVGTDGQPGVIKAVRDIAPMTGEAQRVIKDWQFRPSRLNGKEVASSIVLAFAFRPVPASTSY